ncbi:MAG: family 43 glycosylhydrolase [Phocaeicola sp.]
MKNRIIQTLLCLMLPIVTMASLPTEQIHEKDYVAYLFSYFKGNHIDDEAVCYAVSMDGYSYWALNNDQPVIDSKVISSTGGVRDPHILRSQDGKTFYMVLTDMVSDNGWDSNRALILLSSTDLVNWNHSVINMQKKYKGQEKLRRVWAPQTVFDPQVGKNMVYWSMQYVGGPDIIYYAYANEDFTDLEGEPKVLFIPENKTSCIDGDVFTDPVSKKSYFYWGNGYMAGAELNKDMVSLKKKTITVMTPQGGTLQDYAYREGAYVFYRNGLYYFLWSVDDTGSPNYHVAYGTSKSPLGPIEVAKDPVILIQDAAKEIYGPAHNSVLQIPGTDEWYIVYHRINKNFLNDGPGTHREVCIDRMEFNADGTIKKVVPTL